MLAHNFTNEKNERASPILWETHTPIPIPSQSKILHWIPRIALCSPSISKRKQLVELLWNWNVYNIRKLTLHSSFHKWYSLIVAINKQLALHHPTEPAGRNRSGHRKWIASNRSEIMILLASVSHIAG
ncbi:hypothetical protein V6N12_033728 [Hibiscus sabdariffa]|uniref:Uncharacterized protein n=1 Tax=Hibiscus sabdariffa TaxID=183260 RepID=A0ABR1Z7F2_9ROSI